MRDQTAFHFKRLTKTGKVAGFNLQIYGYIKAHKRVCKNYERMIDGTNHINGQISRVACIYANKQMDGHWFRYPTELQLLYDQF